MNLALVLDTLGDTAERALWGSEPGDLGLMRMVGIDRESCHANELHEGSAYDMEVVAPRLVVAMGNLAAGQMTPGFQTMRRHHGRPVLGHTSKYVVMATYHPTEALAYPDALGALAADLGKIELLLLDGLVDLMQPAPVPPEWPASVGFMIFDGERKSGKCLLCGGAGIAAYVGEGLTWRLCKAHAAQSAQWAGKNLEELRYHAEVAVEDAARGKVQRAAERIEDALKVGNQRLIAEEAR